MQMETNMTLTNWTAPPGWSRVPEDFTEHRAGLEAARYRPKDWAYLSWSPPHHPAWWGVKATLWPGLSVVSHSRSTAATRRATHPGSHHHICTRKCIFSRGKLIFQRRVVVHRVVVNGNTAEHRARLEDARGCLGESERQALPSHGLGPPPMESQRPFLMRDPG